MTDNSNNSVSSGNLAGIIAELDKSQVTAVQKGVDPVRALKKVFIPMQSNSRRRKVYKLGLSK